MAVDVSYVSALGAGAISFLSPCVLPLVPPYLCYMAGVSVDQFRGQPGAAGGAAVAAAPVRLPLLIAAFAFVAGFSTVFVALGAGASTIGGLLRAYQQELAIIAGIVIILMGLNFLGVFRIALFSREARFQTRGAPANPFAAYLMGLAFAFGWTPCIGPVLGPILTLAGARDSVGEGAALKASETIMRNLRVLATDQSTSQETENGKTVVRESRTVTLEVTPKMAEKIAVAETIGQLSLSLRSLSDTHSDLESALAAACLFDNHGDEVESGVVRVDVHISRSSLALVCRIIRTLWSQRVPYLSIALYTQVLCETVNSSLGRNENAGTFLPRHDRVATSSS